jgi:presenilin-like A22 family membrane protease
MRKPLIYETGIILITQALALYTGWLMLGTKVLFEGQEMGLRDAMIIADTGSGIASFVAAIAISTIMMVLVLKYLKGRWLYQLLFAYLLFMGIDTVVGFSFGEPLGVAAALLIIAARFLKPTVIVQNIALMIALAGVSAQLAMFFNTQTLVMVLIVASVYDYIAVFKTKHMVTMFTGMMEKGVVLAMVIPDKGSFTDRIDTTLMRQKGETETRHVLIGSGDIAFPSILAVSVFAEYSLISAVAVMLGSMVGLWFDNAWVERNKKPMPALPAITFFALLALGLARLGGF